MKVKYIARKVVAYATLVLIPFVMKVVSNALMIERGGYALGGELFIPIVMAFLAFLIYPKYDLLERYEHRYLLRIRDSTGKVYFVLLKKEEWH